MARRKRTTHYYGLTVGAAFNEWDRSLALGCVEHQPELGMIQFRPSRRLAGKPGAALLADLDAIRGNRAMTAAERAAAYDAAITARR